MTDQYKPVSITLPIGSDPLGEFHYKKPYNRYRRAKLILFSSVFKHHQEFLDKHVSERWNVICSVERSCFNYTITKANIENVPTKWDNETFQDMYNIICYKISSNIAQDNLVRNPYLAKAILNKTISIKEIPKMSSQELYPDKYKEVLERLAKSKNVTQTIKTSAMYKCRRCHQSECVIENLYNRSLDEGVNLKVTCMVCGNEFHA